MRALRPRFMTVPTTAEVRKDATTRVNWAGDPQFNDISGTSMRASENAGTPVIKVGNQYYACQDGVWYLSNDPNGTYAVAQTVPDAVDDSATTDEDTFVEQLLAQSRTGR